MLLVTLAALARLLLASSACAAMAVPYADYVDLITRIVTAAASDASLQPLADELGAISAVTLPDGITVPIDNSGLIDQMRTVRSSTDRNRIAARAQALRAVLVELQAKSTPLLPDSDSAALTARRAILADPDLQRPASTPEQLALPALPQIDSPLLRYALLLIGVVALIVLIVLLGPSLLRFIMELYRSDRLASTAGSDADVATPAEAVQRAEVAASTQDYRRALRLLYLASLLTLDQIGALRYDRAQTNREYIRQVSGRPALASALQPVVETFDDAWYGCRTVTPQGYDAFASRVQTLMERANDEARAPNR